MGLPTVERKEIDILATQWCKHKGVMVILDDVAKQFALDVSNLVLKNFILSMAESVTAKKAAAVGNPQSEAAKITKKPSLITLTDM